jgi:hypothetical protein
MKKAIVSIICILSILGVITYICNGNQVGAIWAIIAFAGWINNLDIHD